MWFWIGLFFGIVAGLFVPSLMSGVDTSWGQMLAGSTYNIPYVPKPVTFSIPSFFAVFLLIGGLLKMGK